jgi:hypothetical protein
MIPNNGGNKFTTDTVAKDVEVPTIFEKSAECANGT